MSDAFSKLRLTIRNKCKFCQELTWGGSQKPGQWRWIRSKVASWVAGVLLYRYTLLCRTVHRVLLPLYLIKHVLWLIPTRITDHNIWIRSYRSRRIRVAASCKSGWIRWATDFYLLDSRDTVFVHEIEII